MEARRCHLQVRDGFRPTTTTATTFISSNIIPHTPTPTTTTTTTTMELLCYYYNYHNYSYAVPGFCGAFITESKLRCTFGVFTETKKT